MWVRLRGFDVSQWEDSFPDTWETCVKSRKMPGMVQNLVDSGINYQYLSMLNWCMSFSHENLVALNKPIQRHDALVLDVFVIGILPQDFLL